jgi:hypothetical protein
VYNGAEALYTSLLYIQIAALSFLLSHVSSVAVIGHLKEINVIESTAKSADGKVYLLAILLCTSKCCALFVFLIKVSNSPRDY